MPLGVSLISVGEAEATLLGGEAHKTWLSTSRLFCFQPHDLRQVL